ncbi:TonB-dependent receptor [Costertonia aggregata]|uniref:TonB-dependent receptor plug domain-containing protein n=1 Tax=Costertonia aggregata TaxID=343403 RepID=A0A7H9ARQ4_9FLAO|nr:TonB-dependent receptor plug domain-containing protein [Costertonia aggregata]QLG46124.1 TonB-dependent receptor plug domain-containing protein [Costertonia aggregata]
MLKTHLKKKVSLFILLLLLPFLYGIHAQDNASDVVSLAIYLQALENDFEIKFSYLDEDIDSLKISKPKAIDLDKILQDIQKQVPVIKIDKIDNRYYTISKRSLITICGTVLDNFEKNTVAGASIEILDSDTALITDVDGSFTLTDIPRKAILQIKYLGFRTKFINAEDLIRSSPCKSILLAPRVEELEEVIVYQFLTTGLAKKDDGSIQLNTNEFGILPGLIEPDVLQTVQALPGIKSINETVSDINIRGGTNDQNLILWDGIKVYQSGHFFGLISAFNPYLTEKVTIIKNGTSAQYGDGVSGVISMESINKISDKPFGGAGFNLINGDAYGQIPVNDKWGFQFSARRSATDFFNTPTYDQFFDRVFQDSELKVNNSPSTNREIIRDENFYFYDFTAKILYDINDNQKIRLSFLNINNNLDYQETDINSDESVFSFLDQTNLSFGGNLESKWTERLSSVVNTYYTKYNLDSQSVFPDPLQQLDQNNQVFETALKINTNYMISDRIHILNGYQFNEVGIINFTNVTQPPFSQNTKGVIRNHAIFNEIDYISSDQKLKARVGVRLNYIQNLGTFDEYILEPRLNINYALGKHFAVELLGEYKNQTTNQVVDLEQNFLGIEKRRWILSNGSTLPITKSKQGSIGFNYDRPKIYIGLEGFYKKVNGVSTATQGFQNQNQFNGEIGEYTIKGVEFLINKKTNDYSAWLSYTYNTNNYTFDAIIPDTFPNNLDVRHNVTFAGTYIYNNFKLSLGLNYRSGRPFTQPDANTPINTSVFPNRINYAEPNSSQLPEYLRADASAIYSFDLSSNIKATFGASVLNFTDRENILNTYYRITDSDGIETVENVSLGITPNFSFRVSF